MSVQQKVFDATIVLFNCGMGQAKMHIISIIPAFLLFLTLLPPMVHVHSGSEDLNKTAEEGIH